eukprot:2015736-Amphidinium_carterae.1
MSAIANFCETTNNQPQQGTSEPADRTCRSSFLLKEHHQQRPSRESRSSQAVYKQKHETLQSSPYSAVSSAMYVCVYSKNCRRACKKHRMKHIMTALTIAITLLFSATFDLLHVTLRRVQPQGHAGMPFKLCKYARLCNIEVNATWKIAHGQIIVLSNIQSSEQQGPELLCPTTLPGYLHNAWPVRSRNMFCTSI